MTKPFLLIAGEHYYPSRGTGDWIGCFATHELAENVVTKNDPDHDVYEYTIAGVEYDWYRIVDLRQWTEKE